MNGDIAVTPAVYNPALQQDAVVISQIPEDGAKPIRCSLHRGDLGRDGHQIAMPPGGPGTFLRLQPLPAPDIPRNTSKTKGEPRKYQDRPSSRSGTRSREDGDSLESWLAGGGDYRRVVRGRDMDLQPHTIFGSTITGTRWSRSSLNRALATK